MSDERSDAMLALGTRVAARDAFGEMHRATLAPVPRQYRNSHRRFPAAERRDYTTQGWFPKRWVRFVESGAVVPWPADDVFVNLPDESVAVAEGTPNKDALNGT